MLKLTLSNILSILGCPKWDRWCEETGISPWACNAGYGDSEYTMSVEDANRWGLLDGALSQQKSYEVMYKGTTAEDPWDDQIEEDWDEEWSNE